MLNRMFASCFNVKKAKDSLLSKIQKILGQMTDYDYSAVPTNDAATAEFPQAETAPIEIIEDPKTTELRKNFETLSGEIHQFKFGSFEEYQILCDKYLKAEEEYQQWVKTQQGSNPATPRFGND